MERSSLFLSQMTACEPIQSESERGSLTAAVPGFGFVDAALMAFRHVEPKGAVLLILAIQGFVAAFAGAARQGLGGRIGR